MDPYGKASDRTDALAYVGAAAGCNAGGLLAGYLMEAHELGLSEEELRAALEVTKVVKNAAATFMDREANKALESIGAASPADDASPAGCCGPDG